MLLLAMAVLADENGEHGEGTASQAEIGEAIGISARSVSRRLAMLRKRKWSPIQVESEHMYRDDGRGRAADVWTLVQVDSRQQCPEPLPRPRRKLRGRPPTCRVWNAEHAWEILAHGRNDDELPAELRPVIERGLSWLKGDAYEFFNAVMLTGHGGDGPLQLLDLTEADLEWLFSDVADHWRQTGEVPDLTPPSRTPEVHGYNPVHSDRWGALQRQRYTEPLSDDERAEATVVSWALVHKETAYGADESNCRGWLASEPFVKQLLSDHPFAYLAVFDFMVELAEAPDQNPARLALLEAVRKCDCTGADVEWLYGPALKHWCETGEFLTPELSVMTGEAA
ncbi:MAG: hypothetical protein R3B89_17050 [Polyangiaceae bacterium]